MNHNNQQPGSADLLPCPFCGSTKIDPAGWSGVDDKGGPGCDDCGALVDSPELWNQRAPAVEQSAEKVELPPPDVIGYTCIGENDAYSPMLVKKIVRQAIAASRRTPTGETTGGDVVAPKWTAHRTIFDGGEIRVDGKVIACIGYHEAHMIVLSYNEAVKKLAAAVSAGQAVQVASEAIHQYRMRMADGTFTNWKECTPEHAAHVQVEEYKNGFEVRKLYAAPVSPPAVQVARLCDALRNIRDYRTDVDDTIAARSMRFYAEQALAAPVSPPDGAMPDLSKLETFDPDRDIPGYMESRAKYGDGDWVKIEDVRELFSAQSAEGSEDFHIGVSVEPKGTYVQVFDGETKLYEQFHEMPADGSAQVAMPRELAQRCLTAMKQAVTFGEAHQGRPPSQTCLFEIEDLQKLLAAHERSDIPARLDDDFRTVIMEAAQVLESAAAHNRQKNRTVLAHSQQERADRLRIGLARIDGDKQDAQGDGNG